MKKTIIMAACIFTLNAFAGEGNHTNMHPNKYCAKMKDGKLVVMHEGIAIISNATLKNGVMIKPDGMVTKKDGSTMMLKEGECIDKDGNMMMEEKKMNEKTKKDKGY
jgi:hypothetical protein